MRFPGRWPLAALAVVALGVQESAEAQELDAGPPDGGMAETGGPFDAGVDDAAPTLAAPTPALPAAEAVAAEAPPPVRIRGRVLAKGGAEPLVAAAVTSGMEIVAETDEDGRFELWLAPGRHRLQIQQPGYEPLDVEVVAQAGRPMRNETVIRLMPRLTGERYQTVVTPPDPQGPRLSLRQEELTRTPGSLGDPLRVIETLPGVSQVVWPAALYNVRGANPGNTGFFVDGVRIPGLFHFALGPSVIHPFFIEQVDFYPGGYPARYGRYVSGIVHARTTQPKVDRPHGSVDVRLLDAGGIVATPINGKQGSVAVAGRISYTGLLLSAFSPDISFNYWDYQARLEHRLGPGRISVFAFGSGDHLRRKEGTQQDLFADVNTHRLQVRWQGGLGPGRLEASTLVGRDYASTFIPELNNLPVAVRSLTSASRLGYQLPLGRSFDLELGADNETQRFAPESISVGLPTQDLLADRTAVLSAGYATLTYRLGDRLIVSPGLRYDLLVQEGTSSWQPGPRLNVRGRVGENTFLKASAGRFVQLPSLPVSVPGFENFGLQSIGLQSSLQASAGFETALPGALTLDMTGFYQRLRVSDLASLFNYEVQTSILELRDGRSYGVELLLRRALTERLYGWLTYTLSKSERVYPPLNIVAASDWDQRHILNLVTSYRLGGGYQIGGRIHYHTGRPYPVFDEATLSSGGNQDRPPIFYGKLPDFFQLDLRFDKRWVFDRYTLDFFVEIINTTASRQVFDLKRRQDGSLDERGFRIALPSLGLHAEW